MILAKDEIHLYFSRPGQISDHELLSRYESLLSDEERAQLARLYYARHRHQYLVTRTLVRTSLSSYYSVKPSDWRFGKNKYGKPEISHPDANLPVRFNLSHAEGLIICGIVLEYNIGVDVEDVQRNTRTTCNKLSAYFSKREIEDIQQLSAEQQKDRFFDYWTLKESYIKARGAGFSIPLDKFSFKFRGNRLEGFSVHPELNDQAEDWQFWRISMNENYRVAVAIQSPKTDFKIKAVNSVPLQSNETVELKYL
jgi:4'-phosphopantetheinyl transferase